MHSTYVDLILLYATLFIGASVLGYYFERALKKVFNAPNKVRLVGPYHPVYGIGVAMSFFICTIVPDFWTRVAIVALAIIACEYLGGVVFNKWLKLNLWDYSRYPLNLQGHICLTHSVGWTLAAAGFALVFPFIQFYMVPAVNCLVIAAAFLIISVHFMRIAPKNGNHSNATVLSKSAE